MVFEMDLRFDWCSELDTDLFDPFIEMICNKFDETRNRRGQSPTQIKETQSKERTATKQIIMALYSAYFTIPIATSKISLPLTKSFYSGSTFSYQAVKNVFDTLKELNCVDIVKGIEDKGYTRIKAIGDLALEFGSIGFRWFPQKPNSSDSLIVLRNYESEGSKKKVIIPTPETDDVSQYRESLFAFNQFLIQHCVALNLQDDQLETLAQDMANKAKEEAEEQPWISEADNQKIAYLDFSRIQLARIFARGDMALGGRFYRGWWQSIPSVYRPHITIDGYKTCEVDYAGMAIGIMYSQVGLQLPLAQDPYDVGLDNWQDKNDPRRKPIKRFFNALINDETGRFRLDKKEQEIVGISHKELKDRVLERHINIADKLMSGAGLETQFIDSEIASYVMLEMMNKDILVLPIHDSFIVQDGYENVLTATMLKAYNYFTGVMGGVSADYPRLSEHFGITNEEFQHEQDRLREEPERGIVGVEELAESIVEKRSSMMDGYVGSWEKWRDS